MGRLTGGHIRYNERRRHGDYEHNDCEIVLHFSFEEGGFNPSFFDGIQAEIRARVHALVTGKESPVPVKDSWAKAVDEVAKVEAPAKKRGPKPKVKTPAPALEELPDEDIGEDEFETDDEVDEVEDFMDGDPEVGPDEIPDSEIEEAVKTKNLSMKEGGPKLRALIGKFGAKGARHITQDKRAAFLKELKTLK